MKVMMNNKTPINNEKVDMDLKAGLRPRLNRGLSLTGFTLVEVTVSMAVFAIFMISASSVFFFVQDSWRRQRNAWDMLQNGQWAIKYISTEARFAQGNINVVNNDNAKGYGALKKPLHYDLPTGTGAYYWMGNNNTHGEANVLYRGEGHNLNDAIDTKSELARFVARNDSSGAAYALFSETGGLLTITLVFRPRPDLPEGKNNRSIVFTTKVRQRI